eukprot:411076-Prorocentrum_minimum.AAC.1
MEKMQEAMMAQQQVLARISQTPQAHEYPTTPAQPLLVSNPNIPPRQNVTNGANGANDANDANDTN